MNKLFEKLLPSRWWKKPVRLTPDQYWAAFSAPLNAQAEAVLHEGVDQFMGHIQQAADIKVSSEMRLRSLDRAMALAQYLQAIETNMETAKQEVARRESEKEAAKQ